eukprot:6193903-Pleurochrysis_carterae.AAC.3
MGHAVCTERAREREGNSERDGETQAARAPPRRIPLAACNPLRRGAAQREAEPARSGNEHTQRWERSESNTRLSPRQKEWLGVCASVDGVFSSETACFAALWLNCLWSAEVHEHRSEHHQLASLMQD